ncbi:MAG: hypothetical protein ACPLRP_05635, partial [Candidatus Bipolaricaulaceae bacterium]
MRTLALVATAFFLWGAFWCWAQEDQGCGVSLPELQCSTGGDVGQQEFGFTIPLGSLIEAINLVLKKLGIPGLPAPVALVVPDVKVVLDTDFRGDAFIGCSSPCCEGLAMSADLALRGEAEIESIPPKYAGFTSLVPVLPEIWDQSSLDQDKGKCGIYAEWKYTQKETVITLSFAGGLFELPLVDTRGEGYADVVVSYGCKDAWGPPRITSWPGELVVPIGGEVEFEVVAEVPSTAVWMILEGTLPPRPLLRFEAESGVEGVTIDITDDYCERGKIQYGGKGIVKVSEDANVKDGQIIETTIRVIDPKGRTDSKPFRIRIVANHPPKAISGSRTIGHWDCAGPVIYGAYDRDLPENFGFGLYFKPTKFPEGWDCSPWISLYLTPSAPGLLRGDCKGENCSVRMTCHYSPCSWPFYPPKPGSHEFRFTVVEYNPHTGKYGFADSGTWTVIVPNQRPMVAVSPSEMRLLPGQEVSAQVTATDSDEDWIELSKASGPGTFPKVGDLGQVSGTWTWEVPFGLRSYSNYVSFVAKDSWEAGYGFLHIRTVNPPKVSDATVIVRRGGTGVAWAYVEDPDSSWVSVHVAPYPGISVSAEVLDDYANPGQGGFMVEFRVSADKALCDGVYPVSFTVTDPDGLSSAGTL